MSKEAGKIPVDPLSKDFIRDIFNVSSTDQLTNEEAVAYSASYLKELDNKSAIRFAEKKGIEQGMERGIEQGIMQGRLQTLREFVRNLRTNGFSDFQIAKLTNEDPKVISSL